MAYIDKELFKQDIKMRYCNNCARPNEIKCRACHVDDMLGEIEDAPTADVVEVKHGEWLENIKVISTVGMTDIKALVGYRCSVCGREEVAKEPYCNCGAKMDGRSDGDGDD